MVADPGYLQPEAGGESRYTWKGTLHRYTQPNNVRSATQVILTLMLLCIGFASMYFALEVSYVLTLALALPTALIQVRLFVLFHDMAHGSLFSSKRANDVLGDVIGVLCFSPYRQWRRRHLIHHATSGNLSRRGWWEIPTASIEEYESMSFRETSLYRLTRSPLLLFSVGAVTFFLIVQRFPVPNQTRRERISLWGTNLALGGIAVGIITLIGWQVALAVWLPVAILSSAVGMWLFYVQHQFEDAYWQTADTWDFYDAAMLGSSLLLMPPVLSWFFTGIGVHHIHHLNPRIPNYRLLAAHLENPEFHTVNTMTVLSSWKCLRANLWDGQHMVSFHEARVLRRASRD